MNNTKPSRTPAALPRGRIAVPGPTHQSTNIKALGVIASSTLSDFATADITYRQQQAVSTIKPSPQNPRRLTIDNAGVTDEVIEQLQPKEDEPHNVWLERIGRYADQAPAEKEFWRGLITLAGSLKMSSMVQPIVVDNEGEIIAGERRWLASRIAGYKNVPVLVRTSTGNEQVAREILAFAENEHRQNLKPVEVVFGARQIADAVLGGCGLANKEILTIAIFQELTGAARTAAAAYAAFARLDHGDPLLEDFEQNPPASIKKAYSAAAARLKEIEQEETAAVFEGTGIAVPTRARATSVNVRLPTNNGMKNMLGWLGKEAPLNSVTTQVLNALIGDWDQVDDQERRERLSEVFRHIAESMEDSNEGEGSANAD